MGEKVEMRRWGGEDEGDGWWRKGWKWGGVIKHLALERGPVGVGGGGGGVGGHFSHTVHVSSVHHIAIFVKSQYVFAHT